MIVQGRDDGFSMKNWHSFPSKMCTKQGWNGGLSINDGHSFIKNVNWKQQTWGFKHQQFGFSYQVISRQKQRWGWDNQTWGFKQHTLKNIDCNNIQNIQYNCGVLQQNDIISGKYENKTYSTNKSERSDNIDRVLTHNQWPLNNHVDLANQLKILPTRKW